MKLSVQDATGRYRPATDEEVLAAAKQSMNRRFRRGVAFTSPAATKAFLHIKLGDLEHEVFCVLWLDQRHRLIAFQELFRGTIDGASVHPREVVTEALKHNAAACVLAHPHPSGEPEPSQADRALTKRLVDALGLIGVRVLDHIVVGESCVSFAERGLL